MHALYFKIDVKKGWEIVDNLDNKTEIDKYMVGAFEGSDSLTFSIDGK